MLPLPGGGVDLGQGGFQGPLENLWERATMVSLDRENEIPACVV